MSIRAMNWAMEQATGCPWTQCLLYVVADAANPEGICWPSADWMADKSQQSRATVYRRLNEMRDMGLLALFPRYLDEDGKVFYEGAAGRRQTSPEIRLIFGAKVDLPRKRTRRIAEENEEDDAEGVSLSATGGPSQGRDTPVATERQGPSHCSDSKKNQNLNPERFPPTPLRGDSGDHQGDQESQPHQTPDGWEVFKRVFEADGTPILRVSIAIPLFASLSAPERELVTRAARGLIAHRGREKKPGVKPSAQTFIREMDAWPGYAKLAPPEPQARIFIPENSSDFAALRVLAVILDRPLPEARFDVERGCKGIWRMGLVPLDLAGLAVFIDKPTEQWCPIEEKSQPFGAWVEKIERWTGRRPEPQRIETGGEKPFEWNGKTTMIKNFIMGLRVPRPFPPRKDGTISPATELSESEAQQFEASG